MAASSLNDSITDLYSNEIETEIKAKEGQGTRKIGDEWTFFNRPFLMDISDAIVSMASLHFP